MSVIEGLHCITSFVHEFISCFSPDILLGLSEVSPDLQNSISLLCEQWWGRSLGDGEGLVPHCLLYLVARTLVEGATVSQGARRVSVLVEGARRVSVLVEGA